MSSASHEAWDARRPAARWASLTTLVLLAACGGEPRESPGAGTKGAAVTDTAPALPADTAAPEPTDTAAAGGTRDTAASQRAQRPAAPAEPATPAKPATPVKPAEPKPDTAAKPTTATAQTDTASGATATAPLRDPYHQAPKDTVDQATYDGWKQFNLNCARCHGEDVLGTTIAPHLLLSLKPDGPINTQESFVQVVCAGRPEKGMPSWCALGMDPAKINQIYAYVKGRSEGKIRPGRPAVKQEG